MAHLIHRFRTLFTLGREDQSFLDAGWIPVFLKFLPDSLKQRVALNVLSWSPHYFYRWKNSRYASLHHKEFIETEFERNRSSRERLCKFILQPHLSPSATVCDYGCGPGWLAHEVSARVQKAYGIDISRGVLQCAQILNGRNNLSFIHTSQLNTLPDNSVDLIYSIAVFQHVSDSSISAILNQMRTKLKEDGRMIIHVALDNEMWQSESDWRADSSIAGKLRLRYSLNCFKRTRKQIEVLFGSSGFHDISIRSMADMCPEPFDDVCTEHAVYVGF